MFWLETVAKRKNVRDLYFIRKQNGDRETIYFRYNKTKLIIVEPFFCLCEFFNFFPLFHASYVGTQPLAGMYSTTMIEDQYFTLVKWLWIGWILVYSQNRYGTLKLTKPNQQKSRTCACILFCMHRYSIKRLNGWSKICESMTSIFSYYSFAIDFACIIYLLRLRIWPCGRKYWCWLTYGKK